MENECDVNHLDADVLLPPRKRLLAGLKKQSLDGEAVSHPSLIVSSCATVSVDASTSSDDFNTRLKNLVSSHSNNADLSPEQIVEASNSVAVAAVKAAHAARAAAEKKAAIAAKAVAAAKSALALVASFSEDASSKERYQKKNKLKKHLPVQLLYKKYQPIENNRTDEELARKLHRAMNSSPRISKNSPNSDSKGHKHKQSKSSPSFEITRISNSGIVLGQDSTSLCNGHAVASKVDSEGSIRDVSSSEDDTKAYKCDKSSRIEIDNEERESSQSTDETWDDVCPGVKKRGRMKLKKLPLSICTFKDKAHPKEDMNARSSPLTEMDTSNHSASNSPLCPVEPAADGVMPIEATSTWKCQELKLPACIKPNKVVQS
ncbi:PHD finger-like protein [Quillaja saponaria]|uniref:PHD finger-like protein n=1 Tax=Quillaja saponaria TaxID=32244 RepID=A0AAD7PF21_QUISA|nr:PHD finger-like protein [Quillaja saponaria]